MKFLYTLFLSFTLFCLSVTTWSQQSFNGPLVDLKLQKWGVSVTTELGVVDGTSNEIVYPVAYDEYLSPYLSLLAWQIEKYRFTGGTLSLNLYNFLFLNVGYWKIFVSGDSAQMDDYDWYYNNLPVWTHHSNHNIFLQQSILYDVSLSMLFNSQGTIAIGVLIGITHKKFAWTDEVNYYIYTTIAENSTYIDEDSPLHDVEYTYLPGVAGISYKVLYTTPYIGVVLNTQTERVSFQALTAYSFLTAVDDHDFHIQRGIHFMDRFRFCHTINAGVDTKLFIQHNIFLNLKANFFYIFENKGVYQYGVEWDPDGDTYDGAGIQFSTLAVSAAVGFRL